MRIPYLALCAVALAVQVAPARAALLQTHAPEIDSHGVDSIVDRAIATRRIPGAAVAIVWRDSVLYSRGYGVTDLRAGVPVSTKTIFQIASTTKPFTALVALQLVREGKLALDRAARSYLPWLGAKYSSITIEQLLNHTSGVRYDLRRQNIDEFTMDEFKRRLDTAAVAFPAGTRWQYSNTGYTLLALAAEAVTGKDFATILRERIFGPAGMHDSGYRVPQTRDGRHAVGYDFVNGVLEEAPHVFSGWGNSGIESTVADLSKWVAALQTDKLLPRAWLRRMEQPGLLLDGKQIQFDFAGAPASYGMGWFITTHRGDQLITHGGAIAGFNSVVNRFEALTIIVLSNGKQGSDRRGQANFIADAILDHLATQRSR